MKKYIVVITLLLCGVAHAEDVLFATNGEFKPAAGQNIQSRNAIFVLHFTAPCQLPIAIAPDMRQYDMLYNNGEQTIRWTGCWGAALSGRLVLMDPDGKRKSYYLQMFGKGKLSNDGKMILVEKAEPGQQAE